MSQKALDMTTEKHTLRLIYLNNLAKAQSLKFTNTSAPEDLNRAIETHTELVAITPTDRRSFVAHLSNLAVGLMQRGRSNDLIDDLTKSVTS